MKLKDIIINVFTNQNHQSKNDFLINGISIHSDQVRNNFIFAAMKGNHIMA